ncbi:hypothetical protein TSH58p_18275 (plasmid) [Azospirillum sp. TSH58]|uniref:acyltransferase family protein n=1 Tax=Azospirillum sp. TSH58 TaxID=664962 RepID=UPI000D5FEA44|nr:acyltransferase family protein [Azospirillum sp. TSH58]AWJ85514.1 hypothetical protein TSH58p_18275 [Azospirillum sp. TSH58]
MSEKTQALPQSTSPIIQNGQIGEINGLRGLAIIATLYCHAIGNFFQPGGVFFEALDWRIGGVNVSLAKLLDSGDLGVELFFFLSAFVLYRPYVAGTRRMESRRDVLSFLRHRSARLLPLYFLCGFLSLFVVRRFDIFNPEQWLVFGEFLTATHIFDAKNFMPGYNWVYWSINLEIWFGFIFPVLVLLFRAPFVAAIVLSLLPVTVWGLHTYAPNALPFTPPTALWVMVISHLPSFTLGMLAVHTLDRNPVQRQSLRIPMLLLAVVLILLGSRGGITVLVPAVPGTAEKLSAALGFYLLFITVTRSQGGLNRLLCNRVLQVLGMMCYSIYVWHGIMMAYIIGQDPTPGGRMFLLLPFFPLMFAVAAFSYRYIEFPGRPVSELFLLRRNPAPREKAAATTADAPAWTDRPSWANGLAAVAIITVLAFHITGLFWRGIGSITPDPLLYLAGIPRPDTEPAVALMAFGRLGIDLLIVLAAYALYHPFADGRRSMNRAEAMGFYRRQAGRLLPLYGFCGLVSYTLSFTFHPYEAVYWRWLAEYLTVSHLFIGQNFLPPYNWSFWALDLAIWGSLIFPALVLAFRYAALPTVLAGCLLPWGVPLLYRWTTGTAPSAPFWTAVPPQASVAILGMAAAWVSVRVPEDIRRWRRPLLALSALLVVVGAVVPGPAGVLAAAAGFAAAIVALGATQGRLNGILASWPLQWVGLMAVSLFVWHLVVAHRLIDQGGTPLGQVTAAAVCLGALLIIAALSYRYLEFGHRPTSELFPWTRTRKKAELEEFLPIAEERPPVPA